MIISVGISCQIWLVCLFELTTESVGRLCCVGFGLYLKLTPHSLPQQAEIDASIEVYCDQLVNNCGASVICCGCWLAVIRSKMTSVSADIVFACFLTRNISYRKFKQQLKKTWHNVTAYYHLRNTLLISYKF